MFWPKWEWCAGLTAVSIGFTHACPSNCLGGNPFSIDRRAPVDLCAIRPDALDAANAVDVTDERAVCAAYHAIIHRGIGDRVTDTVFRGGEKNDDLSVLAILALCRRGQALKRSAPERRELTDLPVVDAVADSHHGRTRSLRWHREPPQPARFGFGTALLGRVLF
ncbi:hypothetical protein MB84_27880 (plasmid) [Pandoraea oxalativorans]|uniref:Uncharacterized protein n=1 Tax=Pandoraea oxalativorans TaxID=573737 RepID=A0A0G3IHL1_9BURK|nr:hypothetical protein MB84_27880 [Pandoraea oxalativorans]